MDIFDFSLFKGVAAWNESIRVLYRVYGVRWSAGQGWKSVEGQVWKFECKMRVRCNAAFHVDPRYTLVCFGQDKWGRTHKGKMAREREYNQQITHFLFSSFWPNAWEPECTWNASCLGHLGKGQNGMCEWNETCLVIWTKLCRIRLMHVFIPSLIHGHAVILAWLQIDVCLTKLHKLGTSGKREYQGTSLMLKVFLNEASNTP